MRNKGIEEFWRRTLGELSHVPVEAEVTHAPEQSTNFFTTYSVRMTSWRRVKIRAWLSVPNLGRKHYPALMMGPGYGGSIEILSEFVMEGFVLLTLYPRGQGESLKEWRSEAPTYLLDHPTDHENFYYRGAYMDCVRGLDFLCSRPEVDLQRIGVIGSSQSGGLGLATCSLDHRMKSASIHLPFLCNYPVAIQRAMTGPYEQLRKFLAAHPEKKDALPETFSFFDPLNLVDSITCPVAMSIGLKDSTCPPETIRPVFDKIKTKKMLVVYPDLTHMRCQDFRLAELAWLRQTLCA